MAEQLGDAVLSLRTEDSAFAAGVTRAEGRARQLGTTLDKASGSATRLGTEMTGAGRKAEAMGAGFARGGQQVVASAGSQKAGMQQLGFQISDVATMYSLGARPTQIFASQIGQITQAIQLTMGGTSKLAGFLGGPWGIALTAATIVLAPFIARLFETEEAMEAVEFASDAMGDAQGILGNVIDLTTGKVKTQSAALMQLAQAQAIAGRVGAQRRQADARSALGDIAKGEVNALFSPGSLFNKGELKRDRDPASFIAERVLSGELKPGSAIAELDRLGKAGSISPNSLLGALEAISSIGVEGENIKVFEDLQKALGGDKEALAGFLDPAKPKKAKAARKGKKEKTPEEIAADFADETAQLEAETLRARQRLATNAEDRAAIGFELLDIELKQKIAAIEASDFSDEQKAALKKQVATLLGHQTVLDEQGNILVSGTDSLEAQLIARERSAELERDAQGLAQEHYDAVRDVLQLQFDLADTEAERKRLALAMLDAEEAYLRSRLEAVVNSQVANDAEKLRAQVALDAMAATAAQRRESVARANETSVERFMRDLNKTPEQLNEAVDQIKIGGLEAFNSELVNAIVNFRSLGDVARSVVRQMLSEFLQLQIQQNLIRPLAGRLGLGQAAGAGQSSAGELQAAGATMTAAGGTLTTAAGVWSATAAQIQAAAASMAASAAGGGGLGGGGGGGLGGLLGAVGSLLGGASPQASLVGSVEGLFADPSFAGLFAGGGLIPSGQFGIVGEAGPEPVFATDGGVQVLPNSAMRRGSFSAKSGGDTIVIPQTFLVPERSDPRRTKSSVDRGTQQALGVASRKNLA